MDDWFRIHAFIANYLHTFQYVISTEGDRDLKEQYSRYVTKSVPSSGRYQIDR